MSKQSTVLTDPIPDEEIITHVLQGEKDLYALIVRKYNQRLYRVGISIINDDTEVEDAMQVAYIKAYENLGKFKHKSSFATWLTKILINECLLRLKKRKRSISMNDDMMHNMIHQQHLPDAQGPAAKAINTELKRVLEESIRRLPDKYRAVFIMREIEDMNIAETKECLDISEVNVKVRLNRAKAMLRNSLNAYYKKEEILNFHLSRCNTMVEKVIKQIDIL